MYSKHVAGLAAVMCACASLAVTANPSPAAQSFVERVAQDGMTEVRLGKIAMTKSSDKDVQNFGARMVQDHGKANAELASIAKGESIQVPTALDAEHQEMVDTMSARAGADFDAEYARDMQKDHARAIELFKFASSSNDLGPNLSAFASKTLPTLEEHKKMADDLVAGEASQSSSSQ
jgi:putative membrane protein